MPVDAEITDQGPPSFTLPEVRAANVEDWKDKFGADADTAPGKPDGQLIDLASLVQLITLSNQVRLWADTFVRTARGSALDALLDGFGKHRIPAAPSVGSTVFYGDELVAVPLSTQVQTVSSGALFATTAAGSTGALAGASVWVVRVPATVTIGVDYSIDVDATIYTHTAIGGDTSSTVAAALRALVNGGALAVATLAGSDSSGRALLVLDVSSAPGVVGNDGTPTQPRSAVRLPVQATTTGPLTAPAGTLQVLPTAIAGIDAASNSADISPGRDIESDDELRARHLDSLFAPGSTTDAATRARVLAVTDDQGVRFVKTCRVVSNRSDVVVELRPPHSFETILEYTDSPPADAARRVAEAIGKPEAGGALPLGIRPWGLNISENVETYPGNFVLVEASIVQPLYLHLRITVSPGENFPTVGDQVQAIRTAVVNAWDAIAEEAQDWYQTSSSAAVSEAVSGTALSIVVESDVTALPTDVPSFANVVQQVANTREILDLDGSRVAVVIL